MVDERGRMFYLGFVSEPVRSDEVVGHLRGMGKERSLYAKRSNRVRFREDALGSTKACRDRYSKSPAPAPRFPLPVSRFPQ